MAHRNRHIRVHVVEASLFISSFGSYNISMIFISKGNILFTTYSKVFFNFRNIRCTSSDSSIHFIVITTMNEYTLSVTKSINLSKHDTSIFSFVRINSSSNVCSCFKFIVQLVAFFLDDAVSVGVEEFLEVGDLGAELLALVGIGDAHAAGGHLYDLGGGLDVGLADNGVVG